MIGWELDLALDPNHELVRPATKIPWDDLTQEFGRLYVPDHGSLSARTGFFRAD